MGICRVKFSATAAAVVLVALILLASSTREAAATRPLEGELWRSKSLIIQSLQRGPVSGSHRNPCTYIPGRNRGRCTLSQTTAEDVVKGNAVALSPPTHPVEVAAKEAKKEEKSS